MHAQDFARGLLRQLYRAVEKIKSHYEESYEERDNQVA